MNDDGLFTLFIAEARDHLEMAEECLLRLGRDGDDREAVQACFRALHSLKGTAAFFDLHAVTALSHACEHLLDRIRTQVLPPSPDRLEVLLVAVSRLAVLIAQLESSDQPAPGIHMGSAEGESSTVGEVAPGDEELLGQLQAWATPDGSPEPVLPVLDGTKPDTERLTATTTTPAPPAAATSGAASGAPGGAAAGADGGILDDFRSEGTDLMNRVEELLLAASAPVGERLQELFRCFHTLKGIAAYVGYPAVERRAHMAEEALTNQGQVVTAIDDRTRQTLLAAADELRHLVRQPPGADPMAPAEPQPRLGDMLVRQGLSRAEVEAVAARLEPGERLGDRLVAEGKLPRAAVEQAAVQQRALRTGADGFSRVATSKLEDLINLVGELIISQAMVAQDPAVAAAPRLGQVVQRQSRVLRDLQALALNLRMVPLRSTFKKMARAVHDTAYKLGKQVEFRIEGEDTEIDRIIAETLADPLLHMVRNAVDHGIESAVDRVRAGKPSAGRVTLSAAQSGDIVVITLADDGRGLDPDRLVKRAIERKLLPEQARPTVAEALQLIFVPGFSTAETVTGISGRGVGMDVVQRNVQNLKGSIDIDTETGQGTVFTIRLPLTTAILDVMLLRVGAERFLLPVGAVVEATRPEPGQVRNVMRSGRMIESRGQMLPIVPLAELFGIASIPIDDGGEPIMVVIEHFKGRYALAVDEIVGQQQVVIKPLAAGLPHHPGLAGSAILPDGRVGLILDPNRLLHGAAA
jgi:two-component system chemotaxis sensor kinase CheA